MNIPLENDYVRVLKYGWEANPPSLFAAKCLMRFDTISFGKERVKPYIYILVMMCGGFYGIDWPGSPYSDKVEKHLKDWFDTGDPFEEYEEGQEEVTDPESDFNKNLTAVALDKNAKFYGLREYNLKSLLV